LIRFGGLHLVYWAGPKKEETAKVKPGVEVVAFKGILKDVLLLDFEAAKKPMQGGERRYYWSWQA